MGLCQGIYTVTITDNGGCSNVEVITINEPTALALSASSTDITCNGLSDGTATVSVSGGTTPYTYQWNTSPVQNTAAITGLSGGTYTVTVIDGNGCQTATAITIVEPTALTSTIYGTEESCAGGCDGAANLTVLGGTAPYSFNWSTGDNTEDIVDLCAGTYTVTTTDANGCSTIISVTLNPITDIAGGFTYNGNQCVTNNNYIFTNQGDAPGSCGPSCPTFWWDFGDGNTTIGTDAAAANPTHTYTTAGTYTVTQVITDGSGCTDTTTMTIIVNSGPTGTIVGVDESCLNACDGSADLTTTGNPIINYSWSNSAGTEDISNLCTGTYSVTFTDLNGCQDSATVTIGTGTDIKAGFSYNGDQCFTGNNFVFTNLGTVPGFCGINCPTYSWDFGDGNTSSGTNNAAANPTHTYGAPGTYTVTQIVTDGTCADTMTQVITVYDEPVISITPTDVSCNGICDGSATITVISGTTPLTYNWSNFGSTQNIFDLCAGTYDVTVTDPNGCTVTGSTTINEPVPTDPLCNASCDGSIASSISGGNAPFIYLWNDPANQTNSSATGLCQGTFTLIVTDGNGCSDTDSVSLAAPPLLTATIAGNDASCNGVCDGDATVTPSGGTGAYAYSWDGGAGFQITATATGLCVGTYNVTVTDNNNCDTIVSITIGEPIAINLTPSTTDANCGNADGSATVTASGGTPTYIYLWSDGQTTSTAINLSAGGYTVTVTDANGCPESIAIAVSDGGAPTAAITDSTMVSCNGGSDGSATVTASGGTPGYNYLWSDGQTTSAATGLSAGTYTVDAVLPSPLLNLPCSMPPLPPAMT